MNFAKKTICITFLLKLPHYVALIDTIFRFIQPTYIFAQNVLGPLHTGLVRVNVLGPLHTGLVRVNVLGPLHTGLVRVNVYPILKINPCTITSNFLMVMSTIQRLGSILF